MELKPRNDRVDPVTKFCLAMEEFRRTDAGRVKNAKDLVDQFFPHDAAKAVDKIFLHIPREVRAPVVAGWGIRGAKAALRDDDERIREVVHDAILAGDIDAAIFEDGLSPGIITDWVPLPEWWAFWRSGKVSGVPTQIALATARELSLFDDRWFLENVAGRGGTLKGTDAITATLTKEQLIAWMRGLHAGGDGSPAGIVAALGWDVILTKTAPEALLFALDALAKKIGLARESAPAPAGAGTERKTSSFSDAPPDSLVPFTQSGSEWPDPVAPFEAGFPVMAPASMQSASIKPSYGMDDDDEATSDHGNPSTRAPSVAKT